MDQKGEERDEGRVIETLFAGEGQRISTPNQMCSYISCQMLPQNRITKSKLLLSQEMCEVQPLISLFNETH